MKHLRQFDLELGGHAIACAERILLRQSSRDFLVSVSQNQGAPGADEIGIGIAVHIPDLGSLRAVHDDGRAAHCAESAHGTIDAAHQYAAGAVKSLLRTAVLHFRDTSHADSLRRVPSPRDQTAFRALRSAATKNLSVAKLNEPES